MRASIPTFNKNNKHPKMNYGQSHFFHHSQKASILIKSQDALLDTVLDSGYLPHAVIRVGIRRQLRQRLDEIRTSSLTEALDSKMQYVETSRTRPIAVETATANKQHYEVGTGVYAETLGPRMKYSSCLYPKGTETLGEAEVAMLKAYVERAELKDGMRILDLGCGWGSGALFFAEVLPNAKVTAFSNSKTQKQFIDSKAKEKGLKNLNVITGNVVDYEFEPESFDRVVSIEVRRALLPIPEATATDRLD